jgi:type II secretory pathway component PulJ
MKKKNQDGFAILYVLLSALALFIMISIAMRLMHATHKDNRKLRTEIQKRAEELNSKQFPIKKGKN